MNKHTEEYKEFYKNVSERFTAIRESKGLSIQDIVNRSGLSRQTLMNFIKNNFAINMHSLFKLSEALDVSVSELMKIEEKTL